MPFSFTWECQGNLTSQFASRGKRHLDTGHGGPVPLKTYQPHHILLKRFLRRALAPIYPKTRDLRTGDQGQTKISRPAFVPLTVTIAWSLSRFPDLHRFQSRNPGDS